LPDFRLTLPEIAGHRLNITGYYLNFSLEITKSKRAANSEGAPKLFVVFFQIMYNNRAKRR
jgi:hypothetical protein